MRNFFLFWPQGCGFLSPVRTYEGCWEPEPVSFECDTAHISQEEKAPQLSTVMPVVTYRLHGLWRSLDWSWGHPQAVSGLCTGYSAAAEISYLRCRCSLYAVVLFAYLCIQAIHLWWGLTQATLVSKLGIESRRSRGYYVEMSWIGYI